MVPNVNARGQSFMGVSAYLLYGERGAENSERVAWSSTYNMHTDNIEKAAKVMAWTDKEREFIRMQNGGKEQGRKAEAGNVYHYSLSWKDGQDPTREEMEVAARESVARLKLAEHQYFFVAHNDTEHKHVHIVTNLVNPDTGKIASVQRDYRTLDRFAHEYELKTEIVCKERDKKYQAWEQGKDAFAQAAQSKKDRSAVYKAHLTAAYHGADSGKAFLNALEEKGLELAWKDGKRGGHLVVDAQGDVFGLTRLIDGAKQREVSGLLKEIDTKTLRSANELAAERLQSFNDRKAEKGKASRQQSEKQHAEKAAEREAQQRKNQGQGAQKKEQFQLPKLAPANDQQAQVQKPDNEADLIAARNATRADLSKVGGWWSRLFKRADFKAAYTRKAAADKALEDYRKTQESALAPRPAFDRAAQRHHGGREDTRIQAREAVDLKKANAPKPPEMDLQAAAPSRKPANDRQPPPSVRAQFSDNGGVSDAPSVPEQRQASFAEFSQKYRPEPSQQGEGLEQTEEIGQNVDGPKQHL
ncbi:MAG: relaxase/mobilization nuclease domain-containing protein [bacterium]|nr:relaxase/mobilization nuclease domain-containing protein [bacterium]